ncbi:MAG: hypothetical protein JW703_05160 [Candidatus Diapherotrites archaeon]|nr:hypothetical protein [Candidatus Diapherotrites archaeon]
MGVIKKIFKGFGREFKNASKSAGRELWSGLKSEAGKGKTEVWGEFKKIKNGPAKMNEKEAKAINQIFSEWGFKLFKNPGELKEEIKSLNSIVSSIKEHMAEGNLSTIEVADLLEEYSSEYSNVPELQENINKIRALTVKKGFFKRK